MVLSFTESSLDSDEIVLSNHSNKNIFENRKTILPIPLLEINKLKTI